MAQLRLTHHIVSFHACPAIPLVSGEKTNLVVKILDIVFAFHLLPLYSCIFLPYPPIFMNTSSFLCIVINYNIIYSRRSLLLAWLLEARVTNFNSAYFNNIF